jgi:hypothetical protein
MADDKTLRQALDLARADVNRQQPHRALNQLRAIDIQIEDSPETYPWAEAKLISAEALAALEDPGAMYEFEEAIRRISSISERDLALEMRAHEHFAKHLAEKRHTGRAREHYQLAERIAEEAELREDADRIHLCIILIDLQSGHDPRLSSFQNLKRAAAEEANTYREQLAAWVHYLDEFRHRQTGLVYARQREVASVDYFRGVLSLIRKSGHGTAD